MEFLGDRFCHTLIWQPFHFSLRRRITWQFAHVFDIPFCYHVGRKNGINTGQIQSGSVDRGLGTLCH
jgi:hypothetical protein